MHQMPNTKSIYVKKGRDEDEPDMNLRPESRLKIRNFLVQRNDNAARAYARFPGVADLEMILGKAVTAKAIGDRPENQSFSML